MGVLTKFAEPSSEHSDPAVLFRLYLDFYRGELVRRMHALSDDDLRRSTLPSGWTPIEMLGHLVHMEQRWFVWGFLALDVAEPWGDEVDGVWHVRPGVGLQELLDRLSAGAVVTNQVLTDNRLDTSAASGGRFSDELPSLMWICFHVLQEYARHLGHLDVVVEQLGGPVGEAK